MGFLGTVALGIAGSFIGGFLGYVLFDKDISEGALQASGVIGSIIGAILALLIWRALGGRGRTARRPARSLSGSIRATKSPTMLFLECGECGFERSRGTELGGPSRGASAEGIPAGLQTKIAVRPRAALADGWSGARVEPGCRREL